jgi:hypothetical protein
VRREATPAIIIATCFDLQPVERRIENTRDYLAQLRDRGFDPQKVYAIALEVQQPGVGLPPYEAVKPREA